MIGAIGSLFIQKCGSNDKVGFHILPLTKTKREYKDNKLIKQLTGIIFKGLGIKLFQIKVHKYKNMEE